MKRSGDAGFKNEENDYYMTVMSEARTGQLLPVFERVLPPIPG